MTMTKTLANCLAALLTLVIAFAAGAADAPQAETCRVITDPASAVTVSYGARTYRLASEACAAEFRSDPERFAQLYDALAELEESGKPAAVAAPSLVPN